MMRSAKCYITLVSKSGPNLIWALFFRSSIQFLQFDLHSIPLRHLNTVKVVPTGTLANEWLSLAIGSFKYLNMNLQKIMTSEDYNLSHPLMCIYLTLVGGDRAQSAGNNQPFSKSSQPLRERHSHGHEGWP